MVVEVESLNKTTIFMYS